MRDMTLLWWNENRGCEKNLCLHTKTNVIGDTVAHQNFHVQVCSVVRMMMFSFASFYTTWRPPSFLRAGVFASILESTLGILIITPDVLKACILKIAPAAALLNG